MNRVANKVAIITGGATGIGLAASCLLAQEGATVAITDINEQAGQEAAKLIQESGGKASFWKMNVGSENEVERVIKEIVVIFGHIDVLVNNAGIIGHNKPTHELSEQEWDQVMNINVKGVFFCTKHVIPIMKQSGGGSIINISSLHGLLGTPDYPANHASKGAVRLMSKTDAMLYAKDKIRVNSIHPGYIQTEISKKIANDAPCDRSEAIAQQHRFHPLGHMGEPNDVAYGILYLASDESKFVTASELVIDGGCSGGRLLE